MHACISADLHCVVLSLATLNLISYEMCLELLARDYLSSKKTILYLIRHLVSAHAPAFNVKAAERVYGAEAS